MDETAVVQGTVAKFRGTWGFIKPSDGSGDLFAHAKEIEGDNNNLVEGAAVTFCKTYNEEKGKYEASKISGPGCEVKVEEPRHRRAWTVRVQHAAAVEPEELILYAKNKGGSKFPQKVVQMLDIMLQQHAYGGDKRFKISGSACFLPSTAESLGEGAELWKGFKQNFQVGQIGINLNVDVTGVCNPALVLGACLIPQLLRSNFDLPLQAPRFTARVR